MRQAKRQRGDFQFWWMLPRHLLDEFQVFPLGGAYSAGTPSPVGHDISGLAPGRQAERQGGTGQRGRARANGAMSLLSSVTPRGCRPRKWHPARTRRGAIVWMPPATRLPSATKSAALTEYLRDTRKGCLQRSPSRVLTLCVPFCRRCRRHDDAPALSPLASRYSTGSKLRRLISGLQSSPSM